MFKSLKFCGLALIVLLFIIFFVVKGVFSGSIDKIGAGISNLFNDQASSKVVFIAKPEIRVSVIEGWKNSDILKAFLEKKLLTSESDFILVQQKDYSDQFSFLIDKPKNSDLEGYLYPDTYLFHASSTAKEIVEKMLVNFDKKLSPQMRADIVAQHKTISEIIIMASIIEKEAPIAYASGDNSDAKVISGIFWNRIRNGQALQSCATLAYIIGINKDQYSESDTKIDSPFNTYQNKGLPPTPISNPGILAIEAAIYPTPNNYNYFLTPSGTKKIVYARTYEEHLANKRKYLK